MFNEREWEWKKKMTFFYHPIKKCKKCKKKYDKGTNLDTCPDCRKKAKKKRFF